MDATLFLRFAGRLLASFLAKSRPALMPLVAVDQTSLAACLQPADVLLVEGTSRFSTGIKYLTQSTWSHAALYVGNRQQNQIMPGDSAEILPCFVEVDIVQGVRLVPITEFKGLHVRLCRPVSLSSQEAGLVVAHAMSRLGQQYDLKNIVDLVRWLIPTPPVPTRFRRKLLTLGSGDPTKAICSTLIASAFQSVRYPILPVVELRKIDDPSCHDCVEELLHMRHHSLFVPRDFDVSPYFQVVKPTLAKDFDHHRLRWADSVQMPEAGVAVLAGVSADESPG